MTYRQDQLPTPTVANTAAVVVSYYPDQAFAERLASLRSQFAAIFWVDNTPQSTAATDNSMEAGVHYLSRGMNLGLAGGLNLGCDAALQTGFDWAVTFDQDSEPNADFLVRQIACWEMSDSPPFMLGCNYKDDTGRDSPRFAETNRTVECATVITSGSLMCLPLWSELGKFCEGYFIDGVDHEICLRARARQLVVARHGRMLMQHKIGEQAGGYRFLPYQHPPARKYYGMRNGVRNIIQYARTEPAWALRKCITLTWEIIAALLWEPDKRLKLKAMLRGLIDGVKGKMGAAPVEIRS